MASGVDSNPQPHQVTQTLEKYPPTKRATAGYKVARHRHKRPEMNGNSWRTRRHIHYVFCRSCFPLEIHLQSKGKTFQVAMAEYRSNLEGCKWLHCEALKGSEEGAGNRARGEVAGVGGHGGEGRLMTLVH